jgi:hypothetical protein
MTPLRSNTFPVGATVTVAARVAEGSWGSAESRPWYCILASFC